MQLYKLGFSKRLCAVVKLENVTRRVHWSLEWGLCDEFTSYERERQACVVSQMQL